MILNLQLLGFFAIQKQVLEASQNILADVKSLCCKVIYKTLYGIFSLEVTILSLTKMYNFGTIFLKP